MVTNETLYESVVLKKDTRVIQGLSIDGDHWKAREKRHWSVTRCFFETDKSSIDYRTLIEIGLSANIYSCAVVLKTRQIKIWNTVQVI